MNKRVQIAGKELRVVTLEAQEAIWQLAPRDWIGKRKAAIAGIAMRLGWSFARTWNIAHGRARRIDAEEMDRLRIELLRLDHLKERANENRERLNAVIFARHEIAGARGTDRHRDGGSGTGGRGAGESGEAGSGTGPRAAAKTATRG